MNWQIIIILCAALILLEGMILLTATKPTIKALKKMLKNQQRVRFIGAVEALIGLLLLILVIMY